MQRGKCGSGQVCIILRSAMGFGGAEAEPAFIGCRFGLIFTISTSLERKGAPQVNGEEPQIRPGLYSHNFLILPALDTTTQAASLCTSPPRILLDPLTILTPPVTGPLPKHNSQQLPKVSDPKHTKGAQRPKNNSLSSFHLTPAMQRHKAFDLGY